MPNWKPTIFKRYERTLVSSTHPAKIVTDAGPAYLKAINNCLGPGVLVRELVGTKLARWLGLRVLDVAILHLDNLDEIPLQDGLFADPGPSFVSRSVRGHPWGGNAKELEALINPEDIPRLVVLDTWIRNRDRHPPPGSNWNPHYDNVFFSEEVDEQGKFCLIAMDHTECLMGSNRSLDGQIFHIERTKDDRIYGLFPQFKPYVVKNNYYEIKAAVEALGKFNKLVIMGIVDDVPMQWLDSEQARLSIIDFVTDRSKYVAESIVKSVKSKCADPQGVFFESGEENEPL